MNEREIRRIAGLDKSPEQILKEYQTRVRLTEARYHSWLGRLLRGRHALITAEKKTPGGLAWSIVGWTFYGASQIALILLVHMSIMDPALAFAAAAAAAFAAAFAAAAAFAGAVAGAGAFAVVFAFAGVFAAAFAAAAAFAGAVAGAGAFAVAFTAAFAFAAAQVTDQPFWSTFARLVTDLLFPPIQIALRVVDLWIVRHPEHPLLAEAPVPALATADDCARFVRQEYTKGIVQIRQDLLGEKSNLASQEAFLREELRQIRADAEAVDADLREHAESRPYLINDLRTTRDMLRACEERYQARLDRLQKKVVPRLEAILNRLEARVARLDISLQIAERLRRIRERAELDDQRLDSVDQAMFHEVQQVANQLLRLQAALAGSLPDMSATTPEARYDRWLQEVEVEAEAVADLEEAARPSPLVH